jgi:ribose transport system ATP-binding protein
MLRLQGVTKWFGNFEALRSVDLAVAPGEVVGLVGANGAGKSTLLKVLGGLYPDAEYSGALDGKRLNLSSAAAALDAGIGVVHQEIELVPNFTVAENMLLGHEPTASYPFGVRLMRRRLLQERAMRILHEVGLGGLQPDEVVANLPIEVRQIVQVARVLALDAKVVVFDEPTARLSAAGRARLFSVIDRLRRAGKMVVFVSHYLEEVFGVADRVVVLRDGRLAGDHPTRDIDVPGLIKLMLGDVKLSARNDEIRKGEAILAVRALNAEPHFRNIDFDVRAFEVLGITGIIGSGRHELVRSLIGEHDAGGSVKIGGKEMLRSSAARVVGRYLGFVPEDRKRDGIVPRLSVSDNLSLPWLRKLSTAGIVSNSKIRRRAIELIGRLRLVCASPSQPVGELSGGNQQKAVLGRWLGSNMPVVLLESPTVGVDVAGKEEIRQIVRSLAAEGIAVLVSTDDPWELEQLTDRILVMTRGELRGEFQTKAMRHADLLSSLIGIGPTAIEVTRERPPGPGPARRGSPSDAGHAREPHDVVSLRGNE